MPDGIVIEFRLSKKLCITCGLVPALDWPYICADCAKSIVEKRKAERQRQDDDDTRLYATRNPRRSDPA